MTNTDPFAAWFLVSGDATPGGISIEEVSPGSARRRWFRRYYIYVFTTLHTEPSPPNLSSRWLHMTALDGDSEAACLLAYCWNNGLILKLPEFLKLTTTDPFAAWFVVIGDATSDGLSI